MNEGMTMLKRLTERFDRTPQVDPEAVSSAPRADLSDLHRRFSDEHQVRLRAAEKMADSCGSANVPADGQSNLPAVEHRIAHQYAQDVAKLRTRVGGFLETHRTQADALQRRLARSDDAWDLETEALVQSEIAARDTRLQEADTTHRRRAQSLTERFNRTFQVPFRRAVKQWESMRSSLGRTESDSWLPNRWVYFAAMCGIGVGEFFFNQSAFALMGGNQLETMWMALMLVVAVPFMGHAVGAVLKRPETPGGAVVRVGMPVVLTVLVLALSYIVAEQRLIHIAMMTDLEVGHTQLWFSVLLSALLYFASVVLSYFHHDSSSAFAKVRKTYDDAERRYTRALQDAEREREAIAKEYEAARDSILSESGNTIVAIRNRRAALEARRAEHASLYNEKLTEAQGHERAIADRYGETIHAFRSENVLMRGSQAEANCFQLAPAALPMVFAEQRPMRCGRRGDGENSQATAGDDGRQSIGFGHAEVAKTGDGA
jgi:hypothetical protein